MTTEDLAPDPVVALECYASAAWRVRNMLLLILLLAGFVFVAPWTKLPTPLLVIAVLCLIGVAGAIVELQRTYSKPLVVIDSRGITDQRSGTFLPWTHIQSVSADRFEGAPILRVDIVRGALNIESRLPSSTSLAVLGCQPHYASVFRLEHSDKPSDGSPGSTISLAVKFARVSPSLGQVRDYLIDNFPDKTVDDENRHWAFHTE